jgi:hypothetical protein
MCVCGMRGLIGIKGIDSKKKKRECVCIKECVLAFV